VNDKCRWRRLAAAAVADVVRKDASDRQQLLSRAQRGDGVGHLSVGMRQTSRVVQEAAVDQLVPGVPAHLLRRQQASSYPDHARSGRISSVMLL